MTRPLRIEYPGAVYHITNRGNARQNIFLSNSDHLSFFDIFASTVRRYNWICHSYCLMDNHYHLLIETPDPNLSLGMRQLNGMYTQHFNRSHNRIGHLFQGRFKSILVEKENYLLELCRYIVLNPVAAGIVASPNDFVWSSYRFLAKSVKKPEFLFTDWVLNQFDSKENVARRLYSEFVTDNMGVNNELKPWEHLVGQFILGNDTFIQNIKIFVDDKKDLKEIPKQQRYTGRPLLEVLLPEQNKGDKDKRNTAIISAHLSYGYTLKEIANHIGIHYTTVSRVVSAGNKNVRL